MLRPLSFAELAKKHGMTDKSQEDKAGSSGYAPAAMVATGSKTANGFGKKSDSVSRSPEERFFPKPPSGG